MPSQGQPVQNAAMGLQDMNVTPYVCTTNNTHTNNLYRIATIIDENRLEYGFPHLREGVFKK